MEKYKVYLEKLSKLRKHPRQFRLMVIVAAALVVMLACTCISIGIQGNIQSKYSNAIAVMQEQLYQGMVNMTQTFSYIDDPSVDVQNKLIPELRAEYARVNALNTALANGFGAKHAVLDEEFISRIDNAFSQYQTAYKNMSPTGLAAANMKSCIDDMQEMVDARYEDHSDDPIIIG